MSHQKIDKLFKERLGNLEQTPSAEAWTKLEGMLASKKKKALYFRLQIAATVALVLLSGWVIWSSQRSVLNPDPSPMAQVAPLIDSATHQSVAKSDVMPLTKEPHSAIEVKDEKTNKATPLPQKAVPQKMLANKVEKKPLGVDTVILQTNTEVMLADNKRHDEELQKQVNETLPPVMIIYKQNTSEAIAQTPENTNEKVTWNAVLTVAKDFKDGNLNLTSRIKEAKEDLFSLRFNNKNKDNTK